jgi:flagellar FliJ protein
MPSREELVRLKNLQIDGARQKVIQIEGMIAEFEGVVGQLEHDIKAEEDRVGIRDPAHFAYPSYAKAAMQRRQNLLRSVDELRSQLEKAKVALADALEELKSIELFGERGLAAGSRSAGSESGIANDIAAATG